jgi:hypothetical protein
MKKLMLVTIVFFILSSCSGGGSTENTQTMCGETQITRLSLNDKFRLDLAAFEIKDKKAIKTTFKSKDAVSDKITTFRAIKVYIANYEIALSDDMVYYPSNKGEYLIEIEYRGEAVADNETPIIKTGDFIPLALDQETKKPKVAISLHHENIMIFGRVLKIQANGIAGDATLNKLTE